MQLPGLFTKTLCLTPSSQWSRPITRQQCGLGRNIHWWGNQVVQKTKTNMTTQEDGGIATDIFVFRRFNHRFAFFKKSVKRFEMFLLCPSGFIEINPRSIFCQTPLWVQHKCIWLLPGLTRITEIHFMIPMETISMWKTMWELDFWPRFEPRSVLEVICCLCFKHTLYNQLT